MKEENMTLILLEDDFDKSQLVASAIYTYRNKVLTWVLSEMLATPLVEKYLDL
jgi:hypothetical protein